jgi:hypothetical protein
LATLLLGNDADIVTISKILGQTTTQMTLLYAKRQLSQRFSAMQGLEKAMNGK